MQNKKASEEMLDNLYTLITSIENKEDCKLLFDDLCTMNEIEQMAQRIKAASLLLEGKTYTQVIEQCDISSATLSRVSKCIKYSQGYNKFLK